MNHTPVRTALVENNDLDSSAWNKVYLSVWLFHMPLWEYQSLVGRARLLFFYVLPWKVKAGRASAKNPGVGGVVLHVLLLGFCCGWIMEKENVMTTWRVSGHVTEAPPFCAVNRAHVHIAISCWALYLCCLVKKNHKASRNRVWFSICSHDDDDNVTVQGLSDNWWTAGWPCDDTSCVNEIITSEISIFGAGRRITTWNESGWNKSPQCNASWKQRKTVKAQRSVFISTVVKTKGSTGRITTFTTCTSLLSAGANRIHTKQNFLHSCFQRWERGFREADSSWQKSLESC